MIDMKILRRAHHQHRPALPLQPSNPPAALLLLPPPPLLLLVALWLPLPFVLLRRGLEGVPDLCLGSSDRFPHIHAHCKGPGCLSAAAV